MMRAELAQPHHIESAWQSVQNCHEAFHAQLFSKLKKELLAKIDTLMMTEDRKSYFLHQMNYVHDSKELEALTREMNRLQMEASATCELIYPVITPQHVGWECLYLTESLH